jgi:tRNA (cytidine/uridine-2'-O-)-methyltransferase
VADNSFPLHIVLYQPEIPPNTGNIGRSCVALGAKLWIIGPAGFSFDSKQIRRSGLDYWNDLSWEMVDSWEQFTARLPAQRLWLITKYGTQAHCDVKFQWGDVLVFGRESSGLPDWLHAQFPQQQVVIPMPGRVRCLNLSTAAGIVMYEAARQMGMLSMEGAVAGAPSATAQVDG